MNSLFDFTMKDIEGEMRPLADFKSRAVLVVNVASRCGLTPQYEGLQRLYDEFRRQGLEILAFPCNQFMAQEPGDSGEIRDFAQIQYGVTFPLFSKIEVNGEGRAPLYQWLLASEPAVEGGSDVQWNFEKFLIDGEGQVCARFEPQAEPCSEQVKDAIRDLVSG